MKSKLILSFLVIFISFQAVKASTPKARKVKKETKGLVIDVVPITEGKYKLFCKGAGKSPVYVTIYDRTSNVVIQDEIDIRMDFSKVYDFSKLKSDNYTIEVATDSKRIYQNIAFFDKKK